MKRWVPLTMFAVCAGLAVLLCKVLFIGGMLGRPNTMLGVLATVIGSALGILGLYHLKRAHTTVAAFHQPRRLVTNGIYRFTRNPVYLGLAFILAGVCALMGAHCLLIPVAIFLVVINRLVIRNEERMLHAKFGNDYDEYRSRTPRWV